MRQPTLTPHVYQYVKERRTAGTFAPATISGVKSTLLSFAEHCGTLPPTRIEPHHLETWLAGKAVARGTARTQFSQVRTFLRWMVRHGRLKTDPTIHLVAPKAPRPVPRAVDHDGIRHLISTLPDTRARFMVVWAVQLGLRAVELARLEVGDIDTGQRSVVIVGKGGWQRLLPITDEAWTALGDYLREHPAHAGPLLRNLNDPRQGLTPQWVSRLLSGWMRAAGLTQTGHGLRHSTATHVLRGGTADLRDVQDMLGHQALTSTAVYLPHADLDRLRRVMEGRRYTNNSQSTRKAS